MFYLLLAIISSSLLAIILRFSENKSTSVLGVCLFNYITCAVEGGCFSLLSSGVNPFSAPLSVMAISIITGIALLVSLILYKVNISNNGTPLAALFSKLGVIIPILFSFVFFGEKAKLIQLIGILLAIVAILVINLGGKGENKSKVNKGNFITHGTSALVILLIIGGLCDSMSKIYEYLCPRDFDDAYLFLGFFFAGVITLISMIIKRQKINRYDVIFGVLVGIPNYFVSRFLLKALTSVPSFIVYPSYSVGTVVLISILSLIIFKEKLNNRQKVGMGLIMVSLVFLNL